MTDQITDPPEADGLTEDEWAQLRELNVWPDAWLIAAVRREQTISAWVREATRQMKRFS